MYFYECITQPCHSFEKKIKIVHPINNETHLLYKLSKQLNPYFFRTSMETSLLCEEHQHENKKKFIVIKKKYKLIFLLFFISKTIFLKKNRKNKI